MIAATPDGYFTPRRPDRADQRKVTAAHAWRSATAFGHRGAAAMSTAPPRPANNVFPKQLLEVLSDKNSTGIIEWLPHGHAFAIKNTDRFSVEVMPKFTRGKLTSFQRQLNLYGFRKVTKGADCKAGALVYFHPAFKRGRPEMMTGIKRIACKGELSLNRLRNDDVPYDPSVPSEETLEPEQDVNSLKKAARKRKRGWRDDRGVTKKGGESPPISPSGTRSGAVKEELRKLLRLHTEPLHPVSCDANDGLVTRPPPAASVDLKDLPTRSTDYMLKASALSRLNSMYPKFTLPEPSGDGSRRFLESGATTPPDFIGISSDSSPNVANVVSEGGDSVLPKRLNIALPKQYVLKKEKQQMEHLKSRDGPVVLPTHLNLPPPCSNLTKNEVEELLPVPLAPMNPPSSIPSNLSFSKRFGSNTSLLSLSGPIKRSVSEASDMWRIDDIDSELDFNGLFD